MSNISSVRGLRERAAEKLCIDMIEMRAVENGNVVEDYDGMPELLNPADDKEEEDETVQQKMLSVGIEYDKKGYACAPWWRIRGKKGEIER